MRIHKPARRKWTVKLTAAASCLALCCGCAAPSSGPAATPAPAPADGWALRPAAGVNAADAQALFKQAQNDHGINDTQRFRVIELTGAALPMDEIFSRAELNALFCLALETEALTPLAVEASWTEAGVPHTAAGLDLSAFIALCGADLSESGRTLQITAAGEAETFVMDQSSSGLIALTVDGASAEDGPVVILGGDAPRIIQGTEQLLLDPEQGDPHYELHNRPPHDESADIPFTLQIFRGDTLQQAMMFTTAQLERWALEAPEAVSGGYYGTIADLDSIQSMGSGGFLDYYEGLRLDWLLREQAGITDWTGSAVLYGRDGRTYAEIPDLAYFTQADQNYYICTPEGRAIYGTVPLLAYSKNGAPLLPDHEHESEGYVRYNTLRAALEEQGIEADLGTVKNHSGPFAACLGNCSGYYGGYQQETAGDCVRMDLYLP